MKNVYVVKFVAVVTAESEQAAEKLAQAEVAEMECLCDTKMLFPNDVLQDLIAKDAMLAECGVFWQTRREVLETLLKTKYKITLHEMDWERVDSLLQDVAEIAKAVEGPRRIQPQ